MPPINTLYLDLMKAYIVASAHNRSEHKVDNSKTEAHQQHIVALWTQVHDTLQGASPALVEAMVDEPSVLNALFSLATSSDDFAGAELWAFDEPVMQAALAIHQVLPATEFRAQHVSELVSASFWEAAKPNSSRALLIGSLLAGPKEHWKAEELWTTGDLFSEMTNTLYRQDDQFFGRQIDVVSQFLHAMQAMSQERSELGKEAQKSLYRMAHSLIADNVIHLYSDIFPKLDGHKLIKECLDSQAKMAWEVNLMDTLDGAVSDEQLSTWFPGRDQRTRKLAQNYPRLQALLDNRMLHRELNKQDVGPTMGRRLKM